MKKYCTLLMLVVSVVTHAQVGDSVFIHRADSDVLQTMKLGFAVPDIPAFKALGLDPSNILRPSEVKDFALALGSFRNKGNFVVPKNLAAEVAPALLIKPWYTLADYQKNG